MTEAGDGAAAYLLFRAGAKLALPLGDVMEILPYPELAEPPGAGAIVAGVINVAGVAVTVLRLASLLGLEEPPATIHCHLLRLKGFEPPIALLSERSASIVEASQVVAAPLSSGATFNDCVKAELITGDTVVAHLLDVDGLMTAEERRRLADYADRAQRRLDALEAAP